MSDYNYDIIKTSVMEWYENVLSRLENQDVITLSQNSDDVSRKKQTGEYTVLGNAEALKNGTSVKLKPGNGEYNNKIVR